MGLCATIGPYCSAVTVVVDRVRVPSLYVKRGYVVVKVRQEYNRSSIISLSLGAAAVVGEADSFGFRAIYPRFMTVSIS
jgi:hypothetical protein